MASSIDQSPLDESNASSVSVLSQELNAEESESSSVATQGTVLGILVALSLSHMLNDTLQSLIPAIYPLLQTSFSLS